MLTYAPDQATAPTRSAKRASGRQILGLDLLRFGSALLVVAFHLAWLNRMYGRSAPFNYTFGYLDRFTCNGWIGVDIFFTLSGFVIAYSAEHSTPVKFAESRFLRLYPAVWICSSVTLLALIGARGFHAYFLRIWATAFLLLPTANYIDPSYWTLGIELSFYVVVFALLLLHRFRWLGTVLTAYAAVSIACLGYALSLQHGWLRLTAAGQAFESFFDTRWAQLLLLQHASLFALGALLWLALFHALTPGRALAICLCTVGCLLSILHDRLAVAKTAGTAVPAAPSLAI